MLTRAPLPKAAACDNAGSDDFPRDDKQDKPKEEVRRRLRRARGPVAGLAADSSGSAKHQMARMATLRETCTLGCMPWVTCSARRPKRDGTDR